MPQISRRRLLVRMGAVAGGAAAWQVGSLALAQAKVPIAIYKSPTCGCCKVWVAHMEANGFAPDVKDLPDVGPIKRANRVTPALSSCHTALVGGYVIEGHVPAADVKRLLAERPAGVAGLTIPGMPASAPGMDLKPFQPYTVLSFDAQGKTSVFARHDRE